MPCKPALFAADLLPDGTATDSHLEITMDDEIHIPDLAADKIRELLLEECSELDEQQAAALKQFIHEIGGMENALAAIAMLGQLEEAAWRLPTLPSVEHGRHPSCAAGSR